jgi:predicted Zn-dependent protease
MNQSYRYVLKTAVTISVALLIISCATVPHTGRRQLNLISDRQVNELALKAFNEVIDRGPLTTDPKVLDVVKRVSDRIIKAAEETDKPGFNWDVQVIEKDVPNAACLPGGKILVFSGILPFAKNEAGLATIIAHETAHAVARHGSERLSQQLALSGAVNLGGVILKGDQQQLDKKTRLLLSAIGLGGTVGIILPFSRTHEFEADRIGQIYMAKAGYDPAESINLWDRMAKINKPPIPAWLSTHPADQERVNRLRESLPQTQKLYSEARERLGLGIPL